MTIIKQSVDESYLKKGLSMVNDLFQGSELSDLKKPSGIEGLKELEV